MPAAALQAEVAACIDRFADQVDEDGRRLVVRNGNHTERTTPSPTPRRWPLAARRWPLAAGRWRRQHQANAPKLRYQRTRL